MIRAARSGDTIAEIEQRVHVRMARQSLLTQDDPIDLRVVLDEAVRSRPVGGDEVMRDQLLRLIAGARRPNVTIRGLRKYDSIFETIRATALDPGESIEMIGMLVEESLWKLKRRVSGSI